MTDHYEEALDALAHEIWAVAQLAPGESILDGVARIAALLRREAHLAITHCDNLIWMGWTPPEGESVATVRAELSRALRLADEFAALLICTEGQELEPGRWKLTSDQVEYGPHLQAAFEHLKWRGFADVTPLNDGLMVVFTKP